MAGGINSQLTKMAIMFYSWTSPTDGQVKVFVGANTLHWMLVLDRGNSTEGYGLYGTSQSSIQLQPISPTGKEGRKLNRV
ncbi:hypothetical protein KHA80_06425 [Anaerobacillus sp. HL2]|nr:hypothetical protein KHA80_06425 [Anaerobacillus sp. HL2]